MKKSSKKQERVYPQEKIESFNIKDILFDGMEIYSQYTVSDRAIPSSFDGLKPVHRRLLYTAHQLRLSPTARPCKSAELTGSTMGSYHPHGDAGVYGALVTLSQDFTTRYPLFNSQGNWGSIFGASPAASRYTETRLSKFGASLFKDIDYAQMIPNYSGSKSEPIAIPAPLPLALINGYNGIATGIAGNIPSHNIVDVCNASIAYINNPDITIKKLVKILKGPDLPNGMVLTNSEDLLSLYEKGEGVMKYDAQFHYEQDEKNGTYSLVVTNIPFGMVLDAKKSEDNWINKAKVKQALGMIDKNGKEMSSKDMIEYINDSSKENGIRVVFTCDDPRKLRDRIEPFFKNFSQTYRFYLLNNVKFNEKNENIAVNVKVHNLKQMIESWYKARYSIVEYRLKDIISKIETENQKLNARLAVATFANPKKLGEIFVSESEEKAKALLIQVLKINEFQADYLLGCQLRSLLKLNKKTIDEEIKAKKEDLKKYTNDLKRIPELIIADLEYYKKEFKDERKTIIKGVNEEDEEHDFSHIEDNEQLISLLEKGSIFHVELEKNRKKFRVHNEIPLVTTSSKNVGIMYDTGFFENYNTYNTPDVMSGKGNPISVVSEKSKEILCVMPNGKFEVYENKKYEKDTYKLSKKIILAAGINDDDMVLLKYKDGYAFIRAVNLKKLETLKVNNQVPLKLIVVSKGQKLYSNKREEAVISDNLISIDTIKIIPAWSYTKHKLYVLCKERNFAVDKNNECEIIGRVSAIERLGSLKACIPLD